MTVDKVIPCVCSRKFTDRDADEGMPHLVVMNGLKDNVQFWSCYCPECGRGSKLDSFRSPYLALKNWNEFQSQLHAYEDGYDPFVFPHDESQENEQSE